MTTADSATQPGATDESKQLDAQAQQEKEAQEKAAAEAAEAERKAEEEKMRQRAADPRMSMVDEIAARVDAGRAENMVDVPDDDPEARADRDAEEERKRLEAAAKAEEEAERKRQLETQTADITTLTPDQVGKYKVKQTIDGVEREVPLADVLRDAQKGGAADYRLQKATEVLETAVALATEAKGKKEAKDDDKNKSPSVEERVKEATDKMLDGDTEGAAKILSETISQAVAAGRSTVSAEAIAEDVMYRVRAQQAYTTFQTDYKDLVGDKHLAPLVDQEFARLVPKDEKGQPKSLTPEQFGSTLRQAGDAIRSWRDSIGGKKPTEEEQRQEREAAERRSREEKLKAKEDLDQTTGAASRRATSTETSSAEPTPASRAATVQEIAKARGQVI